jgi:hypothetical protein
MPMVWISWSIILYIACVMSFVWRTAAVDNSSPTLLSSRGLLIIRIMISVVLALGIIYFALIMATLRQYGAAMDRAWKERIRGWIEEKVLTASSRPYPSYAPPFYRPMSPYDPSTYYPTVPRASPEPDDPQDFTPVIPVMPSTSSADVSSSTTRLTKLNTLFNRATRPNQRHPRDSTKVPPHDDSEPSLVDGQRPESMDIPLLPDGYIPINETNGVILLPPPHDFSTSPEKTVQSAVEHHEQEQNVRFRIPLVSTQSSSGEQTHEDTHLQRVPIPPSPTSPVPLSPIAEVIQGDTQSSMKTAESGPSLAETNVNDISRPSLDLDEVLVPPDHRDASHHDTAGAPIVISTNIEDISGYPPDERNTDVH